MGKKTTKRDYLLIPKQYCDKARFWCLYALWNQKTCESYHTVKKQGIELHNGFLKVIFEKNGKTRRFFRILVKIYGSNNRGDRRLSDLRSCASHSMRPDDGTSRHLFLIAMALMGGRESCFLQIYSIEKLCQGCRFRVFTRITGKNTTFFKKNRKTLRYFRILVKIYGSDNCGAARLPFPPQSLKNEKND